MFHSNTIQIQQRFKFKAQKLLFLTYISETLLLGLVMVNVL